MRKILMIDDRQENLIVFKETLQDLISDCEILTCSQPHQAYDLACSSLPDLIISDAFMPEIDGYEICRSCRTDKALKDIPIIILSGSRVDTDARIKFLDAGANIFLTKPIDAAELSAQVETMLRLKSVEDELKIQNIKLEKQVETRTKELHNKMEYIQKTEQYYRNLFENAFDAIILFDPETEKLIDLNDQACKLYGYSKDELLKTSLSQLTQDIDRGRKQISKTLSAGFQKKFETVHRHKDGSEIYLESNSKVINYKGKKAILAVMRDVTERKIANQALQENEEKFRLIADNSPNMIYINVNRRIVYANKICENIMRYKISELCDSSFDMMQLIHPDHHHLVKQNLSNHLQGQEISSYEIIILAKNGKNIPVIISTKLIHYKGEQAILGIVTDITKQKELQKEIDEKENRLRTILETTNEGVLAADLKTRKFVYANPEICEMFGYKSDEILQKNVKDLHPLEALEDVIAKFEAQARGEIKLSANTPCRRKDGSIFYANISTSKAILDGLECNVGFFSDVTERRKIEAALRQSEVRYKRLFNASPISIWEEDFSKIYSYIQSLNKQGVTNFEEYFEQNIDEVRLCASKVKVLDVNDTTVNMFKPNSKEDFIKDLNKIFTEKSLIFFKDQLVKIANQESSYEGKSQNVTFDGEVLDIFLRWSVIPGYENDYSRVLVSLIDVSEQERAKQKIQTLLEEKELLLHEVHHRIKNNMASIESLFKMQSRNTNDERVKTAFIDAISRLRGMRVLYDKLYRTDNFRETKLKAFLPALVDEIVSLFPAKDNLSIHKEFADFMIPIDLNFPICLIINELISNSMKYAFKEDQNKVIKISAKLAGNSVRIEIQDNGIGLPADFDLQTVNGFGLKLVQLLTKQINGNFTYQNNKGTKWILEFDPHKS